MPLVSFLKNGDITIPPLSKSLVSKQCQHNLFIIKLKPSMILGSQINVKGVSPSCWSCTTVHVSIWSPSCILFFLARINYGVEVASKILCAAIPSHPNKFLLLLSWPDFSTLKSSIELTLILRNEHNIFFTTIYPSTINYLVNYRKWLARNVSSWVSDSRLAIIFSSWNNPSCFEGV